MAITGGKDFVKGDPRCWRKGKPKLTPEQKALRSAFGSELSKIIMEISSLSPEQIVAESKRKDLPIIKAGMLKTAVKYVESGDFQKWMEPIVCRVLGKPKETVESITRPVIIEKLNGDKEELTFGK
jgi:hypothetical protein